MGSTKQTKQFYLNNPNIPAKNAELEGTSQSSPELIYFKKILRIIRSQIL